MTQNRNLASFANNISVSTTGNVGISNSAPTDKLSINGTTFFQGNVKFGTSSIAVGLQANGSLGTTGQVLTSNGSSIYWATATTDPTPTVFLLMGA